MTSLEEVNCLSITTLENTNLRKGNIRIHAGADSMEKKINLLSAKNRGKYKKI